MSVYCIDGLATVVATILQGTQLQNGLSKGGAILCHRHLKDIGIDGGVVDGGAISHPDHIGKG